MLNIQGTPEKVLPIKTQTILDKVKVYLWRRLWHPTPVLLPGKSHGRGSLEGCSPWGRWESDTTEQLHFHFSLSCIGEGTGNPVQYSCLENPRDGGAWWAAVYGVAQSWTRLKRLSSSSSSSKVSLDFHPVSWFLLLSSQECLKCLKCELQRYRMIMQTSHL